MNLKEVKEIIKQDKKNNFHPKNRMFIYCYRIGQWLSNNQSNVLCRVLSLLLRFWIKCTINRNNHYPLSANIGGGISLPHNMGIVISGHAVIGKNCTIFHQVTIGADTIKNSEKAPVIGDNVYIGAGSKIIGDVKISDNVKIGANAVVTKDVPYGKTVVGYNRIL